MANWKSTLAFFVFIGVYVFTIYNGAVGAVVATAGYIALYSSLAMMFRNDVSKEHISKLIDKIGSK